MTLAPYAITPSPQGYQLTRNGEPLSQHRRKRDALSYAIEHKSTRQRFA